VARGGARSRTRDGWAVDGCRARGAPWEGARGNAGLPTGREAVRRSRRVGALTAGESRLAQRRGGLSCRIRPGSGAGPREGAYGVPGVMPWRAEVDAGSASGAEVMRPGEERGAGQGDGRGYQRGLGRSACADLLAGAASLSECGDMGSGAFRVAVLFGALAGRRGVLRRLAGAKRGRRKAGRKGFDGDVVEWRYRAGARGAGVGGQDGRVRRGRDAMGRGRGGRGLSRGAWGMVGRRGVPGAVLGAVWL
jgi:hypothetical protein